MDRQIANFVEMEKADFHDFQRGMFFYYDMLRIKVTLNGIQFLITREYLWRYEVQGTGQDQFRQLLEDVRVFYLGN